MSVPAKGLVWLITGSSAGLGRALTRYVIARGHTVIASSRNPAKTPGLVSEVEKAGGRWIALDNTAPEEEINKIVQTAESFFGRIDVVVNMAGVSVLGAFEDIPDAETTYQMNVNFMGPLRIMRAVLPSMRKRRSGVIMNVSSAQGISPGLACGIYAASKAALEAASDSCSQEVAPFGVRVLLILPGAYRTDFASSSVGTHIPPSTEYSGEHPVMARFELLKQLPVVARGSPEKAAKIMFEAATGEGEAGVLIKKENLLRVFLGPDAWKSADKKVHELRKTIDLLEDIAASTDF
jgi:NAD(P)-dependent dehydrogenase (short-subunit alcohol dehydrogenase family)